MFGNILLALLTTAGLAVTSTTAQKICSAPVIEAFSPCACEENALAVRCGDETADQDLKSIFERASLLVDSNFVFDQLYITGQKINSLPANLLGSLKFKEIIIDTNGNLHWMHPDAFNSTYETTTALYWGWSEFMSTEDNHDFWTVVSRFGNLEELDLYANQIHYIPDDAFPQPLPHLKNIRMTQNEVDYLGARFFANLPALERMDFGGIGLTLDKLNPATFEGIGPAVQLHLTWNDFYHLPEDIFRPVLNSVAGLWVGGAQCSWIWCTYERLDCDERIDWICENVDLYEPKLDGYYCREGAGADHIWEYCNNLRNKTIH